MKKNLKDMTILTCCPFCGTETEIAVSASDYFYWQEGKLAQDAFPYLSADERETLISGICPSCWKSMFPPEEEEEEEFDDCDFETGFDPYVGCFTDDC